MKIIISKISTIKPETKRKHQQLLTNIYLTYLCSDALIQYYYAIFFDMKQAFISYELVTGMLADQILCRN